MLVYICLCYILLTYKKKNYFPHFDKTLHFLPIKSGFCNKICTARLFFFFFTILPTSIPHSNKVKDSVQNKTESQLKEKHMMMPSSIVDKKVEK